MTLAEPLVADAANQKLRGGYYTPATIARFLADWVVRRPGDEVLEPSCGDGVLLGEAARRLLELGADPARVARQIQGVELYDSEAARARVRLCALGLPDPGAAVLTGDFFDFDDQAWGIIGRRFDAVVGNPPFLRYHSFPEEQRERAFRIMRTAGLKPTRLTNAWVAFLVATSLRLQDNGRLAMVIPAELLQVGYAAQTRAFLARHFGAITIVTFRRLVFAGIQQEVVLLLAEKQPKVESGIDVVELDDVNDLARYEVTLRERHHLKRLDHADEKWTQYYLDADEIDLLRVAQKHPGLVRLGELGCVDVGVVTGENRFFVMTEEQVRRRGLAEHVLPLVGRTFQLPGLTYGEQDWAENRASGVACHLLNAPAVPIDELPPAVQEYVREGERADLHAGYKCRIRKLWYVPPGPWVPDAFLFRQIHQYPKLVENRTRATATDTIHRVRFHRPEQTEAIAAAFMNSLTFAFMEVMGRSYGGGVLEIEPNEAERLPVPFDAGRMSGLPFVQLDEWERAGKVDALLDAADAVYLRHGLGFDAADVQRFRGIWRKLSGRRLGRKVRAKSAAIAVGEN